MNNLPIDLSIVIVTFNNSGVIRQCLRTLSTAVGDLAAELFVIDNNSSDDTPDILQDSNTWKHLPFHRVERIYNKKNLGYTKGVNQGLEKCRGQFVLMLNPDIIFVGDPFPILLNQLHLENVGVVSPQFRYPDGAIQPSCRRFPTKQDVIFELLGLSKIFRTPVFNKWRMADFDHQHSRDVQQPQGAFLLARRDLLQDVGLLDERFPMFFSDVDWCRRVIDNGRRIRFCAETFVYHHKGASVQQKRAEMIVSSHQSFVGYFTKYDRSFGEKFLTRVIHLLLLAATPLRLLFTET